MKGRYLIGILGGIASGKSTLAGIFTEWGAALIDADKIGHELLEQPEIQRKIRWEWGEDVFNSEGCVDRTRLGSIVFADKLEMEKLSDIVHPPLLENIEQVLQNSCGPVVIDAALLVEFGLASRCDYLIFISAGNDLRRQRVARRRGWSEEEMEKRQAFQGSLEEKQQMAHCTIQNYGSLKDLKEQARTVWENHIR